MSAFKDKTQMTSAFKGHPRWLTLRIGGNCRLCPFPCVAVAIGGGGGGDCQ